MFQIFNVTLKRMFKIKFVILYLLIFVAVIIISSLSIENGDNASLLSLTGNIDLFVENYMVLSFLWFCGIPIILNLVAHGAGIFAAEEFEGTLNLLVIKPITRFQVTVGKILGLMAGQFIYMIASIFIGTAIMTLVIGTDPDVLTSILPLIPSILLYGAFVIVFFTSIVCFLAVLFKKKVATVIVVFAIIGVVYFAPIMVAAVFKGDNNSLINIDYINMNYHLGLIHKLITGAGVRISGTSNFQQTLSIITGTFVNAQVDVDTIQNVQINNVFNMVSKGGALISVICLTGYLACASLLYYFTFTIMKKKDIH